MHYVEYGKGNHDVIILMHGGGLSWWTINHGKDYANMIRQIIAE